MVYTLFKHDTQLALHAHAVPFPKEFDVQRAGVYAAQLAPLTDSVPDTQAHVFAPGPVDVQMELVPQPPLLTVHELVTVVVGGAVVVGATWHATPV